MAGVVDLYGYELSKGDIVAHVTLDLGPGRVTHLIDEFQLVSVQFNDKPLVDLPGQVLSRIGSKRSDNMSQRSTREHNKPKE